MIGGQPLEWDRIPGTGYKVFAERATGRLRDELGVKWKLDGLLKRVLAQYWTLEKLVGIVKLLRRVPELAAESFRKSDSYYYTWSPCELDPTHTLLREWEQTGSDWLLEAYPRLYKKYWSARVRAQDQAAARTPTSERGRDEHVRRDAVQEQQGDATARTSSSASRLKPEFRRLLEEGDTERRYAHPDGRPDRSLMGYRLIMELRRAGHSRDEVREMVRARLPGLAAYDDRPKRFEGDWERSESRYRPPPAAVRSTPDVDDPSTTTKEEAAALACLNLSSPADLCVLLSLCSLPGAPAPGHRALVEMTGYSIRWVNRSIRRLIEGGWLAPAGPSRGPGDMLAQAYEILLPAHVSGKHLDTQPPQRRGGRVLAVVRALRAAAVPLRQALGGDAREDAIAGMMRGEDVVDLLGQIGDSARLAGKRWVSRARSRHAGERRSYRSLLEHVAARSLDRRKRIEVTSSLEEWDRIVRGGRGPS